MSATPRHTAVSRGAAMLLAALMGLGAASGAQAASVASIQRSYDQATGQAQPYGATSRVSDTIPVVDETACTHTFMAHRYRGC